MKIRINTNHIGKRPRFIVQRKRWYGWETIFGADIISTCFAYVKDLEIIANVELIKY